MIEEEFYKEINEQIICTGGLYRTVVPIIVKPIRVAKVADSSLADLNRSRQCYANVLNYNLGDSNFFRRPDEDYEEFVLWRSKYRPVVVISNNGDCEREGNRKVLVIPTKEITNSRSELAHQPYPSQFYMSVHPPQLPKESMAEFTLSYFVEKNLLQPIGLILEKRPLEKLLMKFRGYIASVAEKI